LADLDPANPPTRVRANAFDARRLIGLAEQRASAVAGRDGCVIRVVARDDRGANLESDEQLNRLDVYVEGGRIVGVYAG
jgi:hypothetical protein